MFNFSFFKKQTNLLTTVDIHSHLIPGIDDGAKDMERSIELILELKEMGYKKLITTPHVSDMFPNSTKTILNGYQALTSELKKKEIDIKLEVAAEYYADDNFEKLLQKKDILTFGGDKKYLLFELSYFTRPQELESLIQDIKLAGYTPVLAHPERYTYFHHNTEEYKELKTSTGVMFQINLNSIIGYYSDDVASVVKKLITTGLVDFIGSDAHHKRHTKYLKKSLSSSFYKKIFNLNTILNDFL